jgi:hypothetical protein
MATECTFFSDVLRTFTVIGCMDKTDFNKVKRFISYKGSFLNVVKLELINVQIFIPFSSTL